MRASLLVIDKKPGPTSFDVVRTIKTVMEGQKVGHAGSLDPFASGVLVLLVGRATKLSHALLNADKSYWGEVKLGQATDTMDRTGTVTEEKPLPEMSEDEVVGVLKSFEGVWNQTPPMYSAKKIRGVRFYDLARQNIKVRRAPIPVNLYHINFLSYQPPFLIFEVACSKGTYIRSLADEIGRRLGTCGHLHGLRRLSCGQFTLSDAVTVEGFMNEVPKWMECGYHNYVRLLRTEGLQKRDMNRPGHHLPMPLGDGNSLA